MNRMSYRPDVVITKKRKIEEDQRKSPNLLILRFMSFKV